MLDAIADRERLGVHAHAALVQHREGVARAVAQREHDVVAAQFLARGQRQAADLLLVAPALDQQVDDALPEADLAAQRDDVGTHLLDHAHEAEGADVRLGDIEDLFRRAGLDELGEHLAREVAWVADLAPQLAVRERAGAAFAELHVGLRIELALAPQAPGVLGALAHFLAAFEDDGPQPHLREDQRREDAARAEADDDRAPAPGAFEEAIGRVADEAVAGVGRHPHVRVARKAREHGRFVDGQLAVDGVDQHDGRLLARVVAALEDGERRQVRITNAQARHDRRTQGVLGVIQRQAQFGDSKHESVSQDAKHAATETAARRVAAERTKEPAGSSSRLSGDVGKCTRANAANA